VSTLNTSRSAILRTRVTTSWSAVHVWLRSTTLLRQSTMCCKITLHSSRIAESDRQLPRYGLCKRTAYRMVSDDKSHKDASRHQSLSKRPKRTPTFTRAHSPCPRDSAKKRTIKGLGRRRTRKDEDKAWFAEAILEESGPQYLIKYKPVEEGAQCEIS
jgi:hypothetical protein